MLEALPDGIHSGLAKTGARGVFFYFQAKAREGGNLHFWKYFDLKDQRVIDNRYIIANLIACEKDISRVVEPEMFRSIFDLQEKVIEDILRSFQERKALEIVPRAVDPIQQTVATAIQSYLNHPDVERHRAIEAIRFLNQPMLAVQVRELRLAYKDFQRDGDIKALMATVEGLREKLGRELVNSQSTGGETDWQLSREDLRLICFDLITGDKSRGIISDCPARFPSAWDWKGKKQGSENCRRNSPHPSPLPNGGEGMRESQDGGRGKRWSIGRWP